MTTTPTSVIINVEKGKVVLTMTEIILTMQCPFCGKEHSVTTTEEQYAEYCGGELAQVAFADKSATEREQIISHLCPQCQEKIFG